MNKMYIIITEILFIILSIVLSFQILKDKIENDFKKLINKDIIIKENYNIVNLTLKDNNNKIQKETFIKDNNIPISLIINKKEIPLFKDIGLIGSNFLSYKKENGNYYIFGHNGPNEDYIGKWIKDNLKIDDIIKIKTLKGNIEYVIKKIYLFNTINKTYIDFNTTNKIKELKVNNNNIILFTCKDGNNRIVYIGNKIKKKKKENDIKNLKIIKISEKKDIETVINNLKKEGYTNIQVLNNKITFIDKENKKQTIYFNNNQ